MAIVVFLTYPKLVNACYNMLCIKHLNIQSPKVNDNVRKQCKFDRREYCRQQKDCEFFHSNKIWEIYLDKETCWKLDCILRHPKPCRY